MLDGVEQPALRAIPEFVYGVCDAHVTLSRHPVCGVTRLSGRFRAQVKPRGNATLCAILLNRMVAPLLSDGGTTLFGAIAGVIVVDISRPVAWLAEVADRLPGPRPFWGAAFDVLGSLPNRTSPHRLAQSPPGAIRGVEVSSRTVRVARLAGGRATWPNGSPPLPGGSRSRSPSPMQWHSQSWAGVERVRATRLAGSPPRRRPSLRTGGHGEQALAARSRAGIARCPGARERAPHKALTNPLLGLATARAVALDRVVISLSTSASASTKCGERPCR
jgi:hypothetical protein